MHIDTRGSATLHLTDDEYGALRERVPGDTELGRVLADAQPAEVPRIEPVTELQPSERHPEGVLVEVGTIEYTYAISVPPDDQQVAADALRAEGHDEQATVVADNDPEVIV